MRRWIQAAALAVLCVPFGATAQEAAPPKPAPYLRVTEAQAGEVLKLDVAIREFHAAGKPTVFLTGAVHIGDRSFYEALQKFLDKQDLVLFEGVKPAGTGDAANDMDRSDESRAAKTRHRLRFLGIAAAVYRKDHGQNPGSMEELASGVGGRLTPFVRAATDDAWGRPITIGTTAAGKLDLTSLGSDGEPGGEGAAADLRLSDQKPITREERGGGGHGLQQKLASALGLVFQLDAMEHDHANWRSSDMSIDQVQQRLDESGANLDVLSMLEGSSFTARIAEFAVGIIGMLPGGPEMTKLMLMETLSRADEMLSGMPGDMSKLFDVILRDRNAVVMADLARVIKTEPDVRTIGIIYGAGHLPDLQRRLESELGYAPAGDQWNAAITLDLGRAGITAAEAGQIRGMLRRAIDMQLKAKQAK
ncbi:MAG: type II secretion system protein GspG [Phycisphaerales bacterium]|nr:type II secretion system protein GspG [Phycisphaerales bacterium]